MPVLDKDLNFDSGEDFYHTQYKLTLKMKYKVN